MSYVGIGTSDPNHPLEVEGQVFISNVEQGSATNLVPFEVHSDYTGITGDILEGARQFRLRVTPSATTTSNVNMDMGIEPTSGSYFYISNPVVDTALGSNTALRIVQAGHVEIGSNLSVSGIVVTSNIIGGSLLTLSSASLVKVAGLNGLSVTGPWNVDGGGTITGTSATYSGEVKGATVSSTGQVVATGSLTGASLIVSGDVEGTSASLGAIDGSSLIVTGLVQGATVSSTGSLTGASATVSGQVEANGTITTSNKFVHSTGATNNSSYLDESPGLTTDHYVYTRAIVNENQVGSSPSAIVFGNGATYGDDEISLVTDGVTRMYFETGGNVGVGTNNPNTTFDVNGTIRGTSISSTGDVQGASASLGAIDGSTLSVSGDVTCQDATISGSIFHSGDTDTYLTFGTNIVDLNAGGGRRLRADSTGIAIGTNSASAPLHLVWDFNDTLRMQNEGRDDYFNLGCNNQNNFNIRNDAGVGVKLYNDYTAWTVASDERVKKNITILENNLEKLSNIRPVSYHYNHDDDSREKRIGFIAQDWMGVQSEVVSTVDSYEYGIKYTETIPVLCGAIQELVARVAALENR